MHHRIVYYPCYPHPGPKYQVTYAKGRREGCGISFPPYPLGDGPGGTFAVSLKQLAPSEVLECKCNLEKGDYL